MSPMVSFPTSGMQLENAKEIFRCIFDAVGLNVKDSYRFCKQDTQSVSFIMKRLSIHIVSTEEADEMQEEVPTRHQGFFTKAPAALCLENLNVSAHSVSTNAANYLANLSTRLPSEGELRPKDIKIDVSLASATQVVNIAIIRLIMQITETIDVIEEENRFAKKIKSLELVGSHQASRAGAASEKSTIRDFRDLPKNWRTMYNVLQLYTSSQSLLDKDQSNARSGSPQSPLRKSGLFSTIYHSCLDRGLTYFKI